MCKQTNFALFAIALSASCAPSSAPDIREIIITNQPTFDGLTYKKYTTPSEKFTLSGECDPISYSLQSSSDGKSWQTLPGSCPSGKFSIDLNVARITSVFVRAQTKTGFTPASEAVVRHLFPPTSPLFTLVASSQSGDIGTGAPQMQTTMALSYTGAPLSNGSQNLQFYLPGVVYAP